MGVCVVITSTEVRTVKLAPENILSQLREHLNCDRVDALPLAEGIDMWVDDEFLFDMNRDPNWLAIGVARSYLGNAAPALIYGTVVITGATPDGDTVNLSTNDATAVQKRIVALFT